MATTQTLSAEARNGVGKGAARSIRREGRVPGVIYGDKKAPEPITLNPRELQKHFRTGTFLSTLFNIEVDGTATRVIPRDVQLDPVRDFILHVDFLRLGEGATITVEVPVNFLNDEEAPGIKRGGVLNIVRHEIEMLCEADKIPESIDVDLTGMDIGDSLHISQVTLPSGVTPTITDRDFTIVTVAAPAGLTEAEPGEGEGEEEAEGEAAEAEETSEE